MNLSKALAVVAIGGIIAGCGGSNAAGDGAANPSDAAAGGEKHSCKGNGGCKGDKPADAPADGSAAGGEKPADAKTDAPK